MGSRWDKVGDLGGNFDGFASRLLGGAEGWRLWRLSVVLVSMTIAGSCASPGLGAGEAARGWVAR